MAARVLEPEGAGFTEAELALLRALPLMKAESALLALDELHGHFDVGEDRGEIGQIVYAYGMFRGLHSAYAVLGAEFLDADGRPLSEQPGFGVVTLADGGFKARSEVDLP
ncbi:MAG: hypothetical protein JRG96_11905 [Deltaproteobacteria bacterium]|nr:hypothetical protein [Deltaproteobacteria bacterium]MBW2420433.1 hypothetical protein [Deltaproteobacteria bacterium]